MANFTLLLIVMWCGFSMISSIIAVVACLLVWRGCMKMYTEQLKDKSMERRARE